MKKFIIIFFVIIISGCANKVSTTPEFIYKIHFSNTKYEKERELVRPFYEEDIKVVKDEPYFKHWFDNEFLHLDKFDLNEDGEDEILVQAQISLLCGSGGCHTRIYKLLSNNKLKEIYLPHTDHIFLILKERTLDYHDIAFPVNTRGPDWLDGWRVWKWNGREYKHAYFVSDENMQQFFENK